MQTNESKLLELTNKIHALDTEHEGLYTAALAVEASRAKLEANGIASVLWIAQNHIHPRCDSRAGANEIESWFARGGGVDLERLARLDAAAAALARHPGMAAAVAALTPLCDERDRLVATIEADRLAIQAAVARADEAHAAAVARAAAAAESDPAVLAARAALDKLTAEPTPPPPPFRGKVKVDPAGQLLAAMAEE